MILLAADSSLHIIFRACNLEDFVFSKMMNFQNNCSDQNEQ